MVLEIVSTTEEVYTRKIGTSNFRNTKPNISTNSEIGYDFCDYYCFINNCIFSKIST